MSLLNQIVSIANEYKSLNREEEIKLFYDYKNGNQSAKETLLMSNVKLLIKLARQYSGKGVSLDDLFQIGFITMEKNLDKFNPEREGNAKIMSVLRGYIVNAMLDEIATMMGGVSTSRNVKKQHAISLNEKIENDDGGGTEKIDLLEDENNNMNAYFDNDYYSYIRSKLNELDDKQKYIIIHCVMNKETLESVAQKFNCTSENIRIIRNKALKKLKSLL